MSESKKKDDCSALTITFFITASKNSTKHFELFECFLLCFIFLHRGIKLVTNFFLFFVNA